MKWIKANKSLPDKTLGKVLIYRIMNDSQRAMSFSIVDASYVKYCDANETWWMKLPKKPNEP